MKRITVAFLAMIFAISGCSGDDPTSSASLFDSEKSQLLVSSKVVGNSGLPGKAVVLHLMGTGQAYEGTVPDIDGDGEDDPATCFDVDLYSASGQKIGTATRNRAPYASSKVLPSMVRGPPPRGLAVSLELYIFKN